MMSIPMTNAIRFHTTIESENLWIPELAALMGKRVEIIVVEDEPASTTIASPPRRNRNLGGLRGLLRVPDDFDDPLPEDVLRSFEGDE
jgi:hypothetical protein